MPNTDGSSSNDSATRAETDIAASSTYVCGAMATTEASSSSISTQTESEDRVLALVLASFDGADFEAIIDIHLNMGQEDQQEDGQVSEVKCLRAQIEVQRMILGDLGSTWKFNSFGFLGV